MSVLVLRVLRPGHQAVWRLPHRCAHPAAPPPLYRLPPDPFRSPPCAPTGLAGRTLRTVSAWDFASVSAKACDECDNDQKCTGWRTIDNRSATLLTGPIERSHDKCIGGEKWVDPWSGRRYCAVTTVTVPLLRSTRGAAGAAASRAVRACWRQRASRRDGSAQPRDCPVPSRQSSDSFSVPCHVTSATLLPMTRHFHPPPRSQLGQRRAAWRFLVFDACRRGVPRRGAAWDRRLVSRSNTRT